MPPIIRTTRRSPSPRIPRAIPVAEPVAEQPARASRGWQANARGASSAAPRKGLFGAIASAFTPKPRAPSTRAATRASADVTVKSHGKYQSLSQLDYPSQRLGNGNKTIASHGCFLTSMTMASTGLTGKKLDPSTANRIVREGKGFSGGALEAPLAAKALGMKLVDRRAMTNANAATMRNKLDGWLAAGKPAVAGVDLHEGRSTGTGGSDADHFILIVEKNKDGSYAALDPLGGRRITLQVNEKGRLVTDHVVAGSRPYRVDELAFLERR